MRLGRLVMQVCAIILGLAIVVGGYVWYRNNEVQQYMGRLLAPRSNLEDAFALFRVAPSMVCRSDQANFDASTRSVTYYHDGKVRSSHIYLAENNREVHQIIDSTGLYIWGDGEKEILFIPAAYAIAVTYYDDAAEAILRNMQCSVWWRPDSSLFEIPSSLPIVNMAE